MFRPGGRVRLGDPLQDVKSLGVTATTSWAQHPQKSGRAVKRRGMECILNTFPHQSSLFVQAASAETLATRGHHDELPDRARGTLRPPARRQRPPREASGPRSGGADRTDFWLLPPARGLRHTSPRGTNHGEVADLGGTWQRGFVRGRRGQRTFPVFSWDETHGPTAVLVLESPALAARWRALDAFEGVDYRRILVPVHLLDGTLTVANLYAAVLPVP